MRNRRTPLTLLTVLLFVLASGPVKGFGVTLSIGVLASMISALIIARVVTEQAARMGWLQKHPRVSGLASTGRVRDWLRKSDPNIMGRSKLWLGVWEHNPRGIRFYEKCSFVDEGSHPFRIGSDVQTDRIMTLVL